QSEKLIRLLDLYAFRDFADSLQCSERAVDMGLVDIGDGCQLRVIVRVKRLRRGACSAASTTNQSNFNRVADGLGGDDRGKTRCQGDAGSAHCGFEKVAAIRRER